MTPSHDSISHTSSLDLSDDLPPFHPLELSPIDLPSSIDLSPSPIDHRKQRFPSTNLEEDFVNIKWESESVVSDSFCTSFYNAIYPKKFVRWFRGLPRSMRILFISSLFLLLLLISIGIVMFIIFISQPDDQSYPIDQLSTVSPILPKGQIIAMGEFAVPLSVSSMRTLTPSPDSPSVFFAFDNNETLTVIEKKSMKVELRSVKVEGMKHDGCKDYFPLSFSSNADSISANLLPWCCSSSVSSFCYAYNSQVEMDNQVLVYKSFEDNVLFFTTLVQVGNYCNMTNYRITEDQCHFTDHVQQCYGHFVPVQAASSTYRQSKSTGDWTLATAVLLNDNSLYVSDGSSKNSVYSFTSDSIQKDQLLLQYLPDRTMMIGAVGEWGASVARKKDYSFSLLQFVPLLPFSGTLKGAFFDIESSLTLFHSIDNGQSMWISEYAFSWTQ